MVGKSKIRQFKFPNKMEMQGDSQAFCVAFKLFFESLFSPLLCLLFGEVTSLNVHGASISINENIYKFQVSCWKLSTHSKHITHICILGLFFGIMRIAHIWTMLLRLNENNNATKLGNNLLKHWSHLFCPSSCVLTMAIGR